MYQFPAITSNISPTRAHGGSLSTRSICTQALGWTWRECPSRPVPPEDPGLVGSMGVPVCPLTVQLVQARGAGLARGRG